MSPAGPPEGARPARDGAARSFAGEELRGASPAATRASVRIASADVRRLSIPLAVPYHLSFGDVHAFDTILVALRDARGREGVGEATLLTGYTDETIDGAWRRACALARGVDRASIDDLLEAARAVAMREPFVATAFATAAEMLERPSLLFAHADREVELIGTINATAVDEMREEIARLVGAGYRALKIKVGLDAGGDAERVRLALDAVAGRAALRIDANQGFDVDQARAFAAAVPASGVELFEQPCRAGDWDAHAAVARDCPLPLMLDESIYGEADIERAAATHSAAYVKVKLMKLASLSRLQRSIALIEANGMRAVLGNGVASDVGCWMEACVAAGSVTTAGEMNGWLKQRRPLVRNPLRVERGRMQVPANYRPELDDDAIAAATIDRCVVSA